jgi:biofilm PGA synthesis protein PgaA
MSTKRILVSVMLIWAGLSLPAAALSATDSTASAHARAIELARAGSLDESLQLIDELRTADPTNLQLRYDQIAVLGWAERDKEAIAVAIGIDAENAPAYVRRAVAKSFRNVGDFEASATWYSLLLAQNESDVEARIGLVMAYADAGRFGKAHEALNAYPDSDNLPVRLRLTEGYILERQGRYTEALASYQDVLDSEPDNHAALRAMVILLRSMLLPQEALALARQHPGVVSDEEMVHMEADAAALRIRFGAQSSYPPLQRFLGTDNALSNLDDLLAKSDISPAVRHRLRCDRIVALTDRLRAAEAIEEFETNLAQSDDIPVYVLAAVGRAYLHERKPKLARHYFEKALQRDPNNLGIQFRLFYVYTDLQEHGLALELAEKLVQELPPVTYIADTGATQSSDEYLSAVIMVGLARAFADQLKQSQRHFEQLSVTLPHNTDIRQELANVYRWRGWIDRALFEYAQVLAVEPGHVSARVGNAHTQLDNRDYASVERELLYLKEKYPFEPAVTRLEERWNVHNRQELTVQTRVGQSTGNTFGEDQYEIDATWYSQPLAYRYRAFVTSHDSFAEFPEGEMRRERMGVGVEYRHKRWLAVAQLAGDRAGGNVGLRGSIDYRVNDYLEFGGRVETRSNSMPLRGERAGISSDLLGLNAAYSRHESTAVEVGLALQDFSDGNRSSSLYVNGRQRLITWPRYKLSLLGDVYSSSSDDSDVPYFSPRSSLSWNVGVSNDWLMYRRYDFSLSHNLTGKVGQVDQSGYGADSTWSLEYRFYADFDPRWSVYVGLSRNSNVYDSTREYATYIFGGLRGRF